MGTLVAVRSSWSINWKGSLCLFFLVRLASAVAAAGALVIALQAAVEDLWVDSFVVEFEDIEHDMWVWGRGLWQDLVGYSCLSVALKGRWSGC